MKKTKDFKPTKEQIEFVTQSLLAMADKVAEDLCKDEIEKKRFQKWRKKMPMKAKEKKEGKKEKENKKRNLWKRATGI